MGKKYPHICGSHFKPSVLYLGRRKKFNSGIFGLLFLRLGTLYSKRPSRYRVRQSASNQTKQTFCVGALPIHYGFCLIAVFASASICLCATLAYDFAIIVLAYAVITMGYSFTFKRIPFVDVAVLAGLYYMRIFGGCVVIDCKISYWLSLFSIFIFFGLALLKRYIELSESTDTAKTRGYAQNHLKCVKLAGITSCALSLLVFAAYTQRSAKNIL